MLIKKIKTVHHRYYVIFVRVIDDGAPVIYRGD